MVLNHLSTCASAALIDELHRLHRYFCTGFCTGCTVAAQALHRAAQVGFFEACTGPAQVLWKNPELMTL